MKPTRIAIIAFDAFTDIDVFLAWDLFNRIRHTQWEVKLVGTKESHTSVSGLVTPMHENISWANTADIVFFASGPGTRTLYKDEAYLSQFKLDASRQIIGSMCSGSLLLAALGLIIGKATTYPTSAELLRSLGVEVVEEDMVVNGNIATAAGCLAAVQLVGWMLEKWAGKEASLFVTQSVLPVTQGLKCSYGVAIPQIV